MKKFVILCLLAILIAPLGFSQFFAGGEVFFDAWRSSRHGAPLSGVTVEVSPHFGRRIGNIDAAVLVNYQLNSHPTLLNRLDMGAFVEMRFFNIDRLFLSGRGGVQYRTFGGGTLAYFNANDRLFFHIDPVLGYELSERMSIHFALGVLSYEFLFGQPAAFNHMNFSISPGNRIGVRFRF